MIMDKGKNIINLLKRLLLIFGFGLLALSFASYLFLQILFTGDSFRSASTIEYPWIIGLFGAILVIIGLAIYFREFFQIRKRDVEKWVANTKRKFYVAVLFFIVMIFISAYLLNPLVSPFGMIHDSDLDGVADNADDYPNDPERQKVAGWIVPLNKTSTDTEWVLRVLGIASIASIEYISQSIYLSAPTLDIYVKVWYANGSLSLGRWLNTMSSGIYYNGVKFVDNDLSETLNYWDYFALDKSYYESGSMFELTGGKEQTIFTRIIL